MSNSYIPSKDAELDAWALNFKTLIAATPTNYGLVAADATAISAAYTSWHTAFLAATNPSTRTKGTVETKNVQKANMLTVVRGYAATIRANKAVSNELKIGIGLHVADTTRARGCHVPDLRRQAQRADQLRGGRPRQDRHLLRPLDQRQGRGRPVEPGRLRGDRGVSNNQSRPKSWVRSPQSDPTQDAGPRTQDPPPVGATIHDDQRDPCRAGARQQAGQA
jgi:hypothetical protein